MQNPRTSFSTRVGRTEEKRIHAINRNSGNMTSAAKQQASEKLYFDNHICIPRRSLDVGPLSPFFLVVDVVVALFNARSIGTKEK